MLSVLTAISMLAMPVADTSLQKDSEEVICLATNMYFEARGQSTLGQLAVANVTLNRVKSKRFPDSICKVVYQAKLNWKGNPKKNACHFSWYCDFLPDTVYDRETYLDILKMATIIYRDPDKFIDVTHGGTHYHAKYVDPWWNKGFVQTVTIGEHIFYREE